MESPRKTTADVQPKFRVVERLKTPSQNHWEPTTEMIAPNRTHFLVTNWKTKCLKQPKDSSASHCSLLVTIFYVLFFFQYAFSVRHESSFVESWRDKNCTKSLRMHDQAFRFPTNWIATSAKHRLTIKIHSNNRAASQTKSRNLQRLLILLAD